MSLHPGSVACSDCPVSAVQPARHTSGELYRYQSSESILFVPRAVVARRNVKMRTRFDLTTFRSPRHLEMTVTLQHMNHPPPGHPGAIVSHQSEEHASKLQSPM